MTQQHAVKPARKNVNKIVYAVFVAASIYFFATKDFSQAMVFLGTALIFDPFNANTPFEKRPVYQRVWLFVHAGLVLLALGLMFLGK